MKEHSISISEAQNKITQLPEQFGEEPEAVTRHGKPLMAILPFNTYRSLCDFAANCGKIERNILHKESGTICFTTGF